MIFSVIHLDGLRVFTQAKYCLHSRMNIIAGQNGAGKTTFLEALHLLTCARSFRTRDTKPLINHTQPSLSLFGVLSDGQTVSLKKSLHESLTLLINTKICPTTSILARMIPLQLFYQDIFQLVDAGPSVRRSFIDWGLFHVKHDYLDCMKQYLRLLKQRNALLRMNADNQSFLPWEKMLASVGEEIHIMRQAYMNQLSTVFYDTLPKLSSITCHIQYDKGWSKRTNQKSLLEILNESREGDRHYQYTRFGPHQADIQFHSEDKKVKHYFSRGQQKILLLALKFSQSQLLDKSCIFLMDDVTTELDSLHIEKLFQLITETKGQFFITCHDPATIQQVLLKHEHQIISLDIETP